MYKLPFNLKHNITKFSIFLKLAAYKQTNMIKSESFLRFHFLLRILIGPIKQSQILALNLDRDLCQLWALWKHYAYNQFAYKVHIYKIIFNSKHKKFQKGIWRQIQLIIPDYSKGLHKSFKNTKISIIKDKYTTCWITIFSFSGVVKGDIYHIRILQFPLIERSFMFLLDSW